MRSRGDEWEFSEGEDGSRTIASSPFLPSSPKKAGLPRHLPTEAPLVNRGTALVVDDDPSCRSVVASMLGIAGWSTVEADSVRDALSHLTQRRLDLILTDLRLPDLPGVALIEAVRRHPHLRAIPVIVCTASDHAREIGQAREAGCSAVLAKPFSFDELVETVEGSVAGADGP